MRLRIMKNGIEDEIVGKVDKEIEMRKKVYILGEGNVGGEMEREM